MLSHSYTAELYRKNNVQKRTKRNITAESMHFVKSKKAKRKKESGVEGGGVWMHYFLTYHHIMPNTSTINSESSK